MCGVIAWSNDWYTVSKKRLTMATETLKSRGPDNIGTVYWGNNGFKTSHNVDGRLKLGMGHTRLSIQDVKDRSNQPYLSEDQRFALVFNGEIYNYLEIRVELEKFGVEFKTSGDTEVVLKALMHWGPEAIRQFNGMWAICLFDSLRQTLFLSRDRYGQKPLFYWQDKTNFVAASEEKAIYSVIGETNRQYKAEFLTHHFRHNKWPSAKSLYKGLHEVPAGGFLEYNLKEKTIQIGSISPFEHFLHTPDPEELKYDFEQSVKLRLRSDVQSAILISGGVDSTVVASHARNLDSAGKLKWFAGDTGHGLDPGFSKSVANSLGVELEMIDVSPSGKKTLGTIREMTAAYEKPAWLLGNSIAMFKMYKYMATQGVKVVLDGTGGDEIFGGYYNFFGPNVLYSIFVQKGHAAAQKFINECKEYKHFNGNLLNQYLEGFKTSDYKILSLVQAQVEFIQKGRLNDWLIQNDRNSMNSSIEARSPFLDKNLIKYVNMEVYDKFNSGFNKFRLRESIPDNIEDDVRWRRDKQGFRWRPNSLVNECRDEILEVVRSSALVKSVFGSLVEKFDQLGESKKLAMYEIGVLDEINQSRLRNERTIYEFNHSLILTSSISKGLKKLSKTISQTELSSSPFRYLAMESIVTENLYQSMINALPDRKLYQQIVPRTMPEHYRSYIHFRDQELDRLPNSIQEFWRVLRDTLFSADFTRTLLKKIPDEVKRRKDQNLKGGKFTVELNLVRDEPQYCLQPHTDAPNRVLSLMFYLPRDKRLQKKGTSIYRPKDSALRCPGTKRHCFEDFKIEKTIPFTPKTVLFLPTSDFSFHGVEPFDPGHGERDFLTLTFRHGADIPIHSGSVEVKI